MLKKLLSWLGTNLGSPLLVFPFQGFIGGLSSFGRWLAQLRPESKALLLAELFDLGTTAWGLHLLPQLWEANPLTIVLGGWVPTVLVKVLVTVFVMLVLEVVDCWPEFVRVVPIVAALPVFWNVFCILFEMLA